MLLPLLGGLYLLLRADDYPLESRTTLWLLRGCGLLDALALLVKPAGVVALPSPRSGSCDAGASQGHH